MPTGSKVPITLQDVMDLLKEATSIVLIWDSKTSAEFALYIGLAVLVVGVLIIEYNRFRS